MIRSELLAVALFNVPPEMVNAFAPVISKPPLVSVNVLPAPMARDWPELEVMTLRVLVVLAPAKVELLPLIKELLVSVPAAVASVA